MAHIWRLTDGEWQPLDLGREGCTLGSDGWIRPVPATEDNWALLTSPSARSLVNGLPIDHGIVILADRDEIRSAAGQIYFSTERLAVVVPYSIGGHGRCPRCKQPMTQGDDAVRCPGCGVWHHATAALPCWTYGDQCAACDHSTSIEAGFRWTPEVL